MAADYTGKALGMFELDNLVACLVAVDIAVKTANIQIQGIERNRLKSGACVKIRGSVSDVRAAMEEALRAAEPISNIVSKNIIASPAEDTEIGLEMTILK